MSIEISVVDDPQEWNNLAKQSPQQTPFHHYEVLDVLENYSGTLYPYVGYKGEEPVGLFPLFSDTKGPVRVAYSPPRHLRVNYLGPILLSQDHLKERKAMKRHRRFIRAVNQEVQDVMAPSHISVQTGIEYDDPRPFLWNGYTAADPYFTYITDITPAADDLIMTFSSDIRQNIRNTPDSSYEIRETDAREIEPVITKLQDRHDEYNLSPAYFEELYHALPKGIMRVYGCYSDGEFIGGQITLEGNGTLLTWQGVGTRDHEVPVMDVMLWEVLRKARDRGLKRIDHGGANSANLSDYKAKFDPEAETYYRLNWSSPIVEVYNDIKKQTIDRLSS